MGVTECRQCAAEAGAKAMQVQQQDPRELGKQSMNGRVERLVERAVRDRYPVHELGLGATGIGAFYDEEVNRYLNLTPGQGQVVYHFAIGYPVTDPRLQA